MYTGSEGLAIAQVTSWLVEELDWDLDFSLPMWKALSSARPQTQDHLFPGVVSWVS